jgi:hypothetical protein
MKPAPFALLVLAVLAATSWPLTSAIGAATATTSAVLRADVQAACAPDATAEQGEQGEELALPPGHPPIPSFRLPPGHPPISSGDPRLPPGHPPIPSGHDAEPSGPGQLFQEPVLLTI